MLTFTLQASHSPSLPILTVRVSPGRSKVDYEHVLADSEREAVADLLTYLENVRYPQLGANTECARVSSEPSRDRICADMSDG